MHTQRHTHPCTVWAQNAQTNQPTRQLFLFACYKLAFGLNGAWDALKAGREDNLLPGLIRYQRRRLKWGLILGRRRNGGKGAAVKSSAAVFRRGGALAKQGVKTGNTQVCAHAQTHPHKASVRQCTICNINVWKRVWIGAWKAQAFRCVALVYF